MRVDNMSSPHNWKKHQQQLQTQLSEKLKQNSGIFIAFLKSTWNFAYSEKKDHFDRLNISEFFHSEKCSYLNAKKQLFQNTLWQWTCSRVPNTAQICMAVLLSHFSIDPWQIDFKNMSLNQMENLQTVSRHVDGR